MEKTSNLLINYIAGQGLFDNEFMSTKVEINDSGEIRRNTTYIVEKSSLDEYAINDPEKTFNLINSIWEKQIEI